MLSTLDISFPTSYCECTTGRQRLGPALFTVATAQTSEGTQDLGTSDEEDGDADDNEPEMFLSDTAGQPLSMEAGTTDWYACQHFQSA